MEELCVLCGIVPLGGCSFLTTAKDVDRDTEKLVKELGSESQGMRQIVRTMLEATGDLTVHRPDGMGYERYNQMLHVAIGHFDEDGECERRGELVRDGRGVELRRVECYTGYGEFSDFIRTVDGKEELVGALSSCTAFDSNPNFMLCEPCFLYLEAWLILEGLPPRSSAFPSHSPEPLSFAGEFYEIVNSQKEGRVSGVGILPAIDYDGIEDTLDQCQDCFLNGLRGVEYIRQAIEAGLRGADLIPALLQDCKAFMFMQPNLYPEPSKESCTPAFTIYRPAHDTIMPNIGTLPNELLLPILHEIPLPSLLALAATCRSLRALILEPSFLDRVLKEAIRWGSLHWLLPVDAVVNEKQRAYDALRLWFAEEYHPKPLQEVDEYPPAEQDSAGPKKREPVPVPPVVPLIMSPHFPLLAFICECWRSDSMRNRRRLWGQVAQFQELWRNYRHHGWRVDRFFSWSTGVENDIGDH